MSNYYQIECSCHYLNDINEKVCGNCGIPLPASINVRRASLPIEVQALNERYRRAKEYIGEQHLANSGEFLEGQVTVNGKAVINTQFTFLWEWLFHNSFSYESYRRQIIKNIRIKAKFENDIKRCVVDSLLFGSENDIIYSALSIVETGLSSYGEITMILRTNSIDKRTSALSQNSYHFLNDLLANGWSVNDPIPPGYMAVWLDLCKLVLAKLHRHLHEGLTIEELASLILHSAGERGKDEFVELFIFGKIVAAAVDKIRIPIVVIDQFSPKEKLMFKELSSKFNIEVY